MNEIKENAKRFLELGRLAIGEGNTKAAIFHFGRSSALAEIAGDEDTKSKAERLARIAIQRSK